MVHHSFGGHKKEVGDFGRHDQTLEKQKTERHQTPTRTMSRQERVSCGGGKFPHFGPWRGPFDPMKPGLLPPCKDQFHGQPWKTWQTRNPSVHRPNQAVEVEIHFHPIPLNTIRTVAVCDAALDLDRPDASTDGGFWAGFTTPE